MDAEDLYHKLNEYLNFELHFVVPEDADEVLVKFCELVVGRAAAAAVSPEPVKLARFFTLYPPDALGLDEDPKWTLTGVLPEEYGDHYSLEAALVDAGVLRQNQCDSESGQFFVYPESEEQGREVARWIDSKLDAYDARADQGVWV